jgi:acetyl-CoA carboxylase/biotin carboxylase 1
MASSASKGVKPHTNGTVPILNGSTSYAAKRKLADHFIGGNRLENAAAGPVKDFVAAHDGHTVITSVSKSGDHNGDMASGKGWTCREIRREVD